MSSGDFWRLAGQGRGELELFFLPPASYWAAADCELAEVGPLNVSGSLLTPPMQCHWGLGPSLKREAHSNKG